MHILMRVARSWQHAGREVVLDLGRDYDLPDPIAQALIALGVASRITAPEPAPFPVLETKRSARAR